MSDLLSIGASGVRSYQTALATTSENIANTATPGYTRRTTTLREVTSATGGLTQLRRVDGQGVTVIGIARATDPLKTAAVLSSGADLASTQTSATWLDRVQSALTGNDLGDRITGFFASSTTLAADPTSTAARASVLEAATSVAGAFSATGGALQQVSDDLDTTADQSVAQLTSLGAALAKVNDGLGRTSAGSSSAAALADQRDSLVEQMSAISDVNVATDDAGRATVRLGGANGPVLVTGSDSGVVTYARTASGQASFVVHGGGQAVALSPSGGALAGIADAATKVTGAQDTLDQVAIDFRDGINGVQAQGQDANGQTGQAMFAVGPTPTDLTLSLSDPAGIAAAATGAGKADNANLASLQSLRTSGNYEARTTALVSDVAATLSAKQTVASAQTSIHDGAVAARDGVSAVNLDDEAVDLLRFQQAYSASSRVIQAAKDTFQSILDIR